MHNYFRGKNYSIPGKIYTIGFENEIEMHRKSNRISKGKNSEVYLNVNDKDLYEDANRMRDEQEEQDLEIQKPRGFKR